MFEYHVNVKIHEIDAAGIMFFANYFKFAHDAFEEFCEAGGLEIKKMLDHAPYILPVVHASMDFKAPVFAGDKLKVRLIFESVGSSSFTILHEIYKEYEVLAATGKIIHVSIDRNTGEKIPVPEEILKLLNSKGSI